MTPTSGDTTSIAPTFAVKVWSAKSELFATLVARSVYVNVPVADG